jgi:glucosamine--fructose-6-phosphate aminotransferase (isomerizing)
MSVWNDILSQANNLHHVIESHATHPRTALDRAVQLTSQSKRILFTGVGSGLNATIPACYYLMNHGIPTQYIDATEAIYGLIHGFKNCTLVLNTRSGETIELVKLVKLAREAGIPTIAVTNEPGSTVGQLAEVCIPTYSRWDDLVVISAYGGMLATELILAGHIAGELGLMLSELKITAGHAQKTLEMAIEMRNRVSSLFDLSQPLYLLGRGASLASTLGGELVLEEMARQVTVAMAAGLFRQGPIEVVDEHFRAVIFEGSDEPARLNANLAEELLALKAGIFWIGRTQLHDALNFQLPDLPAHLLPLLEIIPIHILAYDLANQRGFQPGSVRYIQRVITTESGMLKNKD